MRHRISFPDRFQQFQVSRVRRVGPWDIKRNQPIRVPSSPQLPAATKPGGHRMPRFRSHAAGRRTQTGCHSQLNVDMRRIFTTLHYRSSRARRDFGIIEGSSKLERTSGYDNPAANSLRYRDHGNVGAQSFEIHSPEILEKRGTQPSSSFLSPCASTRNLSVWKTARFVGKEDIAALANGTPTAQKKKLPFMPRRVIQDFHRRSRCVISLPCGSRPENGGNPKRINPAFPRNLFIRSLRQVDNFGSAKRGRIEPRELECSAETFERYAFSAGGTKSVRNFKSRPLTPASSPVNIEICARRLRHELTAISAQHTRFGWLAPIRTPPWSIN